MHDIRFIRDNPDAFDAALARRRLPPMAGEINQTDANRRALQARIQDMQSRRNQVSKNIGELKAKGSDADSLIAEVNDIKAQLPILEATETELAAKLETYLLELPNILDGSVPDGNDKLIMH